MLAAAHGPQQYPCAGAQKRDVAEHLDNEHHPGALGLRGDVPKLTAEKTVMPRCRASVRVSG